MMIHEKKVLMEYFQAIFEGRKNYEVRLANWDCNEGDVLILKEWDEQKKIYTGRVLEKEVSYVAKSRDMNFWPEEEVKKYGYQIIALK